MYYSEFKLRIDSLLKSKNYWLKNNILNFIDDLLQQKQLTKTDKSQIKFIKEEVCKITDPSIERHLSTCIERDLKEQVIEIEKYLKKNI